MQPGTRLGHYRIDAPLGEGGLAAVYRGVDVRSGRAVALKVLDPDRRADNPGLLDRLSREASVLSALRDVPAVVGFVEQFQDAATRCDVLVLELVEGGTLADRLGGPALPLRDVLEWFGHACHALYDVHESGWVHRDIKPDNLILVDDAEHPLRLIDFNSAGSRSLATGKLTRVQGVFPHTPAYLAPECFDGVPPDTSADVYALAMTFSELLIGRHPLLPSGTHDAGTNTAWQRAHEDVPFPHLPSIRPDIPESLQRVLARATAKDRSARTPDAAALWADLKGVWDELAEAAERPSDSPETRSASGPAGAPDPVAPPNRGMRVVLGLAGMGLGLALLIGAAAGVASWREASARAAQEAQRVAAQEAERVRAEEARQAAAEAERRRAAEARAAEEVRRAAEAADRERAASAARARAAALGVDAVPPLVKDPTMREKLSHVLHFGSQFVADRHGMGAVAVEEVGGVLFFEASQGSGAERASVRGVVTEIDDRGFVVRGRKEVEYDTARCVEDGAHRFSDRGHPAYFRGHFSCTGGRVLNSFTGRWGPSSTHHYFDITLDPAWFDKHPDQRPPG